MISRSPIKLSRYRNNNAFNNKIYLFGEKANEKEKKENGLINSLNQGHDKPSGHNANK